MKMSFVDWILAGVALGLIVGALMKIFGKKKDK